LLKRLENQEQDKNKSNKIIPSDRSRFFMEEKSLLVLRDLIQSRLLQQMEEEDIQEEEIREKISIIVEEVKRDQDIVLSRSEREDIISMMTDEILGYGPITPLIRNQEITEVMVNGPNQVYVEKEGRIERTNITFRDENHVMHIIERIVTPLGRRIDESSPMVDARLPDGSRVNAIIHPLALDGPNLTIRKFAEDPYTIDDLINFGTLTPQMALFLRACVQARINILISGGTGSGKTTTLNVLSSFIPSDERIVTIEDDAELQLHQDHIVRLESRPPNIEGEGEVTIRDLVRNTLRMRPDRIIVGEVRSGEALDMLQAMNTGHDGSLTTGHANSPRDMLARLETMVLMAGMEIPVKAIREQISSALDLMVYQARFKDGSRKITNITEIQGMEGDVITMQEIFSYKQRGKDERGRVLGEFIYSGVKPKILDKLEDYGVQLPDGWYK
jgi:pilus assembly protein CpaF